MTGAVSSEQLGGLWTSIVSASASGGGAVLLVSATAGDCASEVAVALAQLAAERVSTAAWLLDLDLFANPHFHALNNATGGLQGPFDMSFGQEPFWRMMPRANDAQQGRAALVGYRMPNSRLFVSHFDRTVLESGQTVKVTPAGPYWAAVRSRVDLTIVDCPPLDRSRVGLAVAADMDGVILILNGERSDPTVAAEIRDEIVMRGGRCLGVVVTKETRSSRGGGGLFGTRRRAAVA